MPGASLTDDNAVMAEIAGAVFTVISAMLYYSEQIKPCWACFVTLTKSSRERGLAHPGCGFGRMLRSP